MSTEERTKSEKRGAGRRAAALPEALRLQARRLRPRRPAGLAPGTIVVDEDSHDLSLRWLRYDVERLEEGEASSVSELAEELADVLPGAGEDARPGSGVVWVQVEGLGDADRLARLGEVLGLHALTLEDVANLDQRPKSETFGDDWLVFLRPTAEETSQTQSFDTWQTAILLRPGLVVSFAERPSDVFEPVLRRLRAGNPRIRSLGSDYLVYALMDAVVDRYLLLIDSVRDFLEELEEKILEDGYSVDLQLLHRIRRDLVRLGRIVKPVPVILGDAIDEVGHPADGSTDVIGSFFSPQVELYLRDCRDHALRAADLVDSYRDSTSSLLDVHLSMVGYRTNEVMKVLTMIATIFIPLSFLAGLYGMNFDTTSPWNMPELSSRFGYPVLLLVMAILGGGLVIFFKRRGWF